MRKLYFILLFTLAALIIGAGVGYQWLMSPFAPASPQRYSLQPGASLTRVSEDLQNIGVLRSAYSLRLLSRFQKNSGQIQTGYYLFNSSATPEEILQRLVAGDVEKVNLTVPEGFTQLQIFNRIAKLGYGNADKLHHLSKHPEFIKSLNIKANSLEGYLFPETYSFNPGTKEEDLLKMMVKQFQKKLTSDLLQKAKALQLDLHQLVTLASIIEKETGKVAEMPIISSVFHNRLRKKIPLQTDPTVIYGIKDFDGNLTRKHLKTPTAYNTYIIRGLPPGPIASPGLAALSAASNPAKSNFLYFVSRGDGSHHFSTNLKEHNQAVRKYQLKRRK